MFLDLTVSLIRSPLYFFYETPVNVTYKRKARPVVFYM